MLSQMTRGQPIDKASRHADLLARGRAVVEAEATALGVLAEHLDESFAEAACLIIDTGRRVVVTGMGKSGHIGRKISATLAATGTNAIFVHPAEAAHGDLGMMTADDVLLVISNSGATPEVRTVMRHARQLGCPIIGIASQPDSPVMHGSDIRLVLPQAREACPVNIAPTTSTTLTLALGDALAVAIMGVRGISRERLQLLHPGGVIGSRLLPVNEIMHDVESLPLVSAGALMRDVLVTMTEKSFGIAGVIDGDGRLVGVITDGDLRRHVDRLFMSTAADVMTLKPKTVPEGTYAEDALAILTANKITALFVMRCDDPDVPVGLVHIHDFTRLGLN